MLIKTLAIVALIILFFLISKSADIIVSHLKILGEKLGVKIFFLGILLGIMTSLPEVTIGINSIINNIESISVGNLIGGTIVLFGLVLSISVILNRKIKTEKQSGPFLLVLAFLFLPLLLGLKGELNYLDGLMLITIYILLMYYLYKSNKEKDGLKVRIINRQNINKHIFFIILGAVGLIVFSNLIVKTTIYILKDYNISTFIIGLLFYSIGTNLPELIIAIRSFKRKMSELSLSNLIGSAMGNSLMLGVLAFIKTIQLDIDTSYLFLMIFNFVFFVILYIFYRTDQLLSRYEGIALLFLYLVFVSSQIFIQLNIV